MAPAQIPENMRQILTKNICTLLFLTLVALFSAGCGGGNDDDFFDDFDFSNDAVNVPIPTNGQPLLIAQFDSYETEIDTVLMVDELFGILANDEYPVFDTVIEAPFFTDQGGDIEVFTNGSFEYDPPIGFQGEDTFTYTIRDTTTGRTSSATVFISVVFPVI